jgi:hypothetical protein
MGNVATVPNLQPGVEHGVWTDVPHEPPGKAKDFVVRLKDADRREHRRVKKTGVLTFHAIGCTGDFLDHRPQDAVAAAMAAQARDPGSLGGPAAKASFLFHLGDIAYKDEDRADPSRADQLQIYNAQFFAPYTAYPRPIVAVPGNHCGKHSAHGGRSPIDHFIDQFCATKKGKSPDNDTDDRPAVKQPYVYWRLDTPVARFIGLYTNVCNGGLLDDPAHLDRRPQYEWLVAQLKDVRKREAKDSARKALLLSAHYPPFSGAANFSVRGDPTLGPTGNAASARPLAEVLAKAYEEAGRRPDAVLSAHAHLYQRLTYRYDDGWEIPHLIAGCGGHTALERMWEDAAKRETPPRPAPFDAAPPPGFALPRKHGLRVDAYADRCFGFMRLTVTTAELLGEFFAVDAASLRLLDSFRLDLQSHRLK